MFVVNLGASIARVDMPGPCEESRRGEPGDQEARRVKGKKGKRPAQPKWLDYLRKGSWGRAAQPLG